MDWNRVGDGVVVAVSAVALVVEDLAAVHLGAAAAVVLGVDSAALLAAVDLVVAVSVLSPAARCHQPVLVSAIPMN